MSRVVFITNYHSDHDYAPASEYGALRPITSGNFPVFKTQRLLEEICDNLRDSTSEDFLLYSGSSAIAALATLVWLSKHHQVNLLLYERKMGRTAYAVRTLAKQDVLKAVEEARTREEADHGTR